MAQVLTSPTKDEKIELPLKSGKRGACTILPPTEDRAKKFRLLTSEMTQYGEQMDFLANDIHRLREQIKEAPREQRAELQGTLTALHKEREELNGKDLDITRDQAKLVVQAPTEDEVDWDALETTEYVEIIGFFAVRSNNASATLKNWRELGRSSVG
jgi:hypothetical protein